MFGGRCERLDRAARDLDGVEADVALSRGRLIHARYLRERAAGAAEPTEERALFERAAAIVEEHSSGLAGQIQEARSELAR